MINLDVYKTAVLGQGLVLDKLNLNVMTDKPDLRVSCRFSADDKLNLNCDDRQARPESVLPALG